MKKKEEKRPLWKKIFIDHGREVAEGVLVTSLIVVLAKQQSTKKALHRAEGELHNQKIIGSGLQRDNQNKVYHQGKLADRVQCLEKIVNVLIGKQQ